MPVRRASAAVGTSVPLQPNYEWNIQEQGENVTIHLCLHPARRRLWAEGHLCLSVLLPRQLESCAGLSSPATSDRGTLRPLCKKLIRCADTSATSILTQPS
jgi:hypothetical protein